MQIELCFTAEGEDSDPRPASLRGLDANVYYRSGRVLNAGHAVTRALVCDALRHWAHAYIIDGFCFIHADNLAQGAAACIVTAMYETLSKCSGPEPLHHALTVA